MKITVKKAYEYSSVKIEHDSTTIDLGMMDAGERDELSREFIEAMWAMGPSGNDECVAWILEIIEACGIELPNAAGSYAPACSASVPEWVAKEIKETWRAAREAGGEMQAFRIIERMVDRLGYGRIKNNPSLVPNDGVQGIQDLSG